MFPCSVLSPKSSLLPIWRVLAFRCVLYIGTIATIARHDPFVPSSRCQWTKVHTEIPVVPGVPDLLTRYPRTKGVFQRLREGGYPIIHANARRSGSPLDVRNWRRPVGDHRLDLVGHANGRSARNPAGNNPRRSGGFRFLAFLRSKNAPPAITVKLREESRRYSRRQSDYRISFWFRSPKIGRPEQKHAQR
jgi:hypothetical protein